MKADTRRVGTHVCPYLVDCLAMREYRAIWPIRGCGITHKLGETDTAEALFLRRECHLEARFGVATPPGCYLDALNWLRSTNGSPITCLFVFETHYAQGTVE